MRQFLRETLELGYWAFFCPSRLQARMNAWSPMPEKNGRRPATAARDILLGCARFAGQYLCLAAFGTLPLALLFARTGRWQDSWLLPVVVVSAYGTGVWALGFGLAWPLLCAIAYHVEPIFYVTTQAVALAWLSFWGEFGWGIAASALCLAFVVGLGDYLLEARQLRAARWFLTIGMGLGVGLGCWLATQDWPLTLGISSLVCVFLWLAHDIMNEYADAVVVVGTESVVMVGMVVSTVVLAAVGAAVGAVISVAVVVVVVVAVTVVGLFFAPVVSFCVVAWLVGAVGAPLRVPWGSVVIAGVMVALGSENLHWSVLLTIPAVLVGYYRLLPLYPVWALLTWSSVLPAPRWLVTMPKPQLHWLPPYTDELLWLPLPGHARLLVEAFRHDPSVALPTFQHLQTSPMAGFRWTARRALPQIVADQLAVVHILADVVHTAALDHPYLPLLLPEFYHPEGSKHAPIILTREQPEIATLLLGLQDAARDVAAALESTSAALRERGLERVHNNLQIRQGQLPGLGLGAQAVERWRPVFAQWHALIQAEIKRQRSVASQELLNPFQFGNPLRPDRAELFKGRSRFADQIVRLVLDRSRPTLVLHGPRRCGKSSFLLNLPRLLPSDILPVYVDLQSAAATGSEADFCFSLVWAIQRDSRSQGINVPAPNRIDFYANPYPALEDWLDAALPRLGRRGILVNLDEFEKLGASITAGRLSERLLDQLRHLIQHYDALGFLFSGVQTLDELGPHWSSYFISVVPTEMLYLEASEARDLLLHPDPDFALQYADSVVDKIVDLTRGQPYLLQLIGANLVKQANLTQTQQADAHLLETALQSAFIDGQIYFTNLWEEFTDKNPAEIAAGQALLTMLAQGKPLAVGEDSAALAALQRLVRYHVLERTASGFRFEIPLVERWVRERSGEWV